MNMRKIYYLSSCNTCKRIIDDLQLEENDFLFQDIKSEPITADQLDQFYRETTSYEQLFNKRARKYHQMNLKNEDLDDKDYRDLILKEYTFLKRPVIQIGDQYFIGNSKKNIQAAKEALHGTD
jgi:arsenate reductase